MDQRNMLTWLDLGRGLIGLRKKIRPGARALATLARMHHGMRMSLGKALERSAARYPHAACIKHEGGELTYMAFNQWVNRIAHHLMASGVRRGDAIAILIDNRPALLAVVAAASKLGAVAAVLNTQQRRQALAHSLRCFTPRLHVVGAELVDVFEEARAESDRGAESAPLELRYVGDGRAGAAPAGYVDLDAAISAQPSHDPPSTGQVRLSDACFYIFTSGTTGLPKASILSHDRWLKAATGFGGACLDLRPGDTVYAPLPLYHNMGLTIAWGGALYTGAAVAIRRKFSARAFWDDCRRHRATAFIYIGEIPKYLLNQAPDPGERGHQVRRILGVGLRPDLWHQVKQRFGIPEIYEIYASSEMNVSFLNLLNLDGTVGFCPSRWAIVAFDVSAGAPVRDARGRLVRVRKGETGLLVTKVTRRFRYEGYTDARASARKLLRDVFRKGDQWFDTGDLMREIGFGHLQFVDRVGDTFRWKSENVSTTEVEKVLGGFAGVAECTVYGVEIPGMPGRAGMAAIVAGDDAQLDLEALGAHLERELPRYAVPVLLRVTGSLVTTGTFKHRKATLRDEGYDPACVQDSLFVRLPDSGAYARLTPELHARIRAGALSL